VHQQDAYPTIRLGHPSLESSWASGRYV